VHCESNFPARKQKSTLDIGLPDGMQDKEWEANALRVVVVMGMMAEEDGTSGHTLWLYVGTRT
jgi:hypothetical protein